MGARPMTTVGHVLGACIPALLASSMAMAQNEAPAEPTAEAAATPPTAERTAENDAYVARLVTALSEDDSYKIRLQAAVFLGRSEDDRAIQPLIRSMSDDNHYTVRAASTTALANLENEAAIPHIINAAALDAESFVREEAKRALRKYERADALRYVWAKFSSEDQRVRLEVIRYLSEGPFEDGEDIYTRALGDDAEILALARQAIMPIPPEQLLRFLENAVEHPNAGVRRGAVQILREIDNKAATEIVLKVYGRDIEVDQVRDATRQALRELRQYLDMKDIVSTAMTDSDKHNRARSLKLLGVVGGDEAKKTLLLALSDSELYLRGTAVMALRGLGDPEAISALEQLLQDPSNQRIALQIRTAVKHLRRAQEEKH